MLKRYENNNETYVFDHEIRNFLESRKIQRPGWIRLRITLCLSERSRRAIPQRIHSLSDKK